MYYENVNGKVYYEVYGEDNEKTIVFSHGVSLDHETFKSQIDALEDEYKVIVWDMPYHGNSSFINNKLQFTKVSAEFILGILDDLELDEAVIVGQSLGSLVAQQFAYSYPERCKATVHLGGVSLYPKSNSLLKLLNPFISLTISLWPKKSLYKTFAKHKAIKEETRRYMERCSSETGKRVISHLTKEMVRDMARGLPEKTNEPKLISYGDHDLSFIKKSSKKWCDQSDNHQLAIINNAHHIANQDNPKEFNDALQSFLESL